MKCNINALKLKEIVNTEWEKQLWTNEVKRQKIEELKAVFWYIKDEEVVTFKKARRKTILENVWPIPEKSDGVAMSEYHDRLQLVRNLMYTKEEYNDLYVNLTQWSISIFLTNAPLEAKKFFNSKLHVRWRETACYAYNKIPHTRYTVHWWARKCCRDYGKRRSYGVR